MDKITGQVIYTGPMIPQLGLQYGAIFRDGIFNHLYVSIAECPALGAMFVRVADYAGVRRQLNFDIARNMRGTAGQHVALYTEVQNWLATKNAGPQKEIAPTIGVKHHAK